jgi:hypothetical protein
MEAVPPSLTALAFASGVALTRDLSYGVGVGVGVGVAARVFCAAAEIPRT